MSIRSLLIQVLVLGGMACADAPVGEPGDTTIDQANGITPSCPSGQTVTWTESTGVCGACTTTRGPGQPSSQFSACSNDIEGTTRLIKNFCATGCVLQ